MLVEHFPDAGSAHLLYLSFLRFLNLLLLLGRSSAPQDVELLMSCHEIAVLRKANPSLDTLGGSSGVFRASLSLAQCCESIA
jgi:hypothetical protein